VNRLRNVWNGLVLIALLLLSVGCSPKAVSEMLSETEQPVETIMLLESKQPETPSEEEPVEESQEEPMEEQQEESLIAEGAIRYASPPEEMPFVTEAFRLPFVFDVEEDATVYVQKVGSTEVFELTSDQAMITLQTLRLTKPTSSEDWIEEEPSGPVALIIISSGTKAYETSLYYEKNVLSTAIDTLSGIGIGYLYAYDTQLSLLLNELFEPQTEKAA